MGFDKQQSRLWQAAKPLTALLLIMWLVGCGFRNEPPATKTDRTAGAGSAAARMPPLEQTRSPASAAASPEALLPAPAPAPAHSAPARTLTPSPIGNSGKPAGVSPPARQSVSFDSHMEKQAANGSGDASQTANKQTDREKTGKRSTQPSAAPAARSRSAQLNLAELRRKYPQSFLFAGPSAVHQVALTFDDAPDPRFTPQILDILRRYQIKATFFIVGSRANEHPELVRRIISEGHAVGNHTFHHAFLPKLSEAKFSGELEETEACLRRLAGYSPKLFRPPYGAINEEQLQWATAHGFLVVNWDVDSRDWRGLDAQRVIRNILPFIHSGAIVLQHGGTGQGGDLSGTVTALPIIIERLQALGYKPVTLPELLHVPVSR